MEHSVHRYTYICIFFGSPCRYVADRLADMDVLQRNVKEEKGLTMYKYRYQVDVYIHIYLPGGATPPLRSLGNTLELDVLAQRGQHLALFLFPERLQQMCITVVGSKNMR